MVVVFLVVVVAAVDPYIYKITNNFLTCKLFSVFFFLLAAVVVVVAVDPYIYKITNNFLTCKLFFCLFLLRAPATRK